MATERVYRTCLPNVSTERCCRIPLYGIKAPSAARLLCVALSVGGFGSGAARGLPCSAGPRRQGCHARSATAIDDAQELLAVERVAGRA
jgi:hypothetical protein